MMAAGTNQPLVSEFLDRQRKLMSVLGIRSDTVTLSELLTDLRVDDAARGLILESSEIMNELAIRSKPWKSKPLDVTRSNIIEELTDVLFYVLEMAILLGMDANSINDLYLTKLRKNVIRVIQSSKDEKQLEEAKSLLEELS